jgi:hypothetical protein
MGAVPVLIMLAAVGVDYGWQPDGTASSRGDNVEYIIQIPPQHLDQIRSAGEITSAIDPSIQGRVSRVVVKVGTGPLPKDAGRISAVADSSSQAAAGSAEARGDGAAIAIPELAVDALAQAAVQRGTGPGSESLMKPDPQVGGFALPDSYTPARTNPAVSTDPAAAPRENWGNLLGQAGNAATGASGNGTAADARPSTDPLAPGTRTQGSSSFSFPTAAGTSPAPSSSLGTPTPAGQSTAFGNGSGGLGTAAREATPTAARRGIVLLIPAIPLGAATEPRRTLARCLRVLHQHKTLCGRSRALRSAQQRTTSPKVSRLSEWEWRHRQLVQTLPKQSLAEMQPATVLTSLAGPWTVADA